ncbi:phage holin family protein [Populibacterium corticicola]|jgi:hypothetical protein|uniref:Phage holin family protein n=1 Tax=Populibacterium corticicola TaxID=1812826 RepID=A0ABW5XGP3_9MICO
MTEQDPHVSDAAEDPQPKSSRRPSIGELVGQVSEQFARLLRAEVTSYTNELKAKATKSALGIGLLAAAGVLALYLLGVLLAAAVAGFANLMPVWAAALTVSGILLLIIAGLALVGVKALKNNVPPMPNEAVNRIKEDLSSIKEDIK